MNLKLKLNQNLSTTKGKLLKDQVITVACSDNGLPLDIFWRNRLKDSAIDNCVQIVNETNNQAVTTRKTSKK